MSFCDPEMRTPWCQDEGCEKCGPKRPRCESPCCTIWNPCTKKRCSKCQDYGFVCEKKGKTPCEIEECKKNGGHYWVPCPDCTNPSQEPVMDVITDPTLKPGEWVKEPGKPIRSNPPSQEPERR